MRGSASSVVEESSSVMRGLSSVVGGSTRVGGASVVGGSSSVVGGASIHRLIPSRMDLALFFNNSVPSYEK